ncbi:MAG: YhbY family RNA-binding protein [Pseudomonadota bacterium]
MKELTGAQRKYLRGLAHDLNPSAYVGQKGLTAALIQEVNQGLDASELIKVRFIDYKEKPVKSSLAQEIASSTGAHLAGLIGHVAIYYRQHSDPEKRGIQLP